MRASINLEPARFGLLVTLILLTAVSTRARASEPGTVQSPHSTEGPVQGQVTFESDIQPLLTRYGCNAGACHGKSRGQNGFALSLLGFDSDFDYDSLVHQARGRRISPAAVDSSLLLQKALGEIPHGGGQKIEPDGKAHKLLREWIAAGAPRTPAEAPQLVRVIVTPERLRMEPNEESQLLVTAVYSDGYHRDVTQAAAFQSNDMAIVAVDAQGRLRAGSLPGETAIMARYMNNIAVSAATIPLAGETTHTMYTSLAGPHRVDQLVQSKLQELGVLPSAEAADSKFQRRAYLRIIGRLPTLEETTAFLEDKSPDKRAELVDRLLERPEYADFWANKWADLLRPNPYRVGIKAVWNLDAWLRTAFRENWPYDKFARELVTARGSTWQNGATVIYRDRPSTVEIGSSVSQLFLGVRLDCAKCHHHPFEVWSQDDFFGFAAFFSRVGHHGGLSPPISGSEELIFTAKQGSLKHGRTGEVVQPKTLSGEVFADLPTDVDPRERLADWMLAPDNPYFAQVMANRVWSELMGRGIVEPVDDLRATNPATNQPLLDFLAQDFREGGYDIKALIRTIATSKTFGLSSTPEQRNQSDTSNFSRYYRQRLRAEVLLDAVNDVLGTEDSFDAMPPGARATQLWTHRSDSVFLDTFGRPDPNQDPPCERTTDSTTPQVLHMMNSPDFNGKLTSDAALPARLAASDLDDHAIVEEMYLRIYSRPPTDAEARQVLAKMPAKNTRRDYLEDVVWALMNTPEFMFID